MQQSLRPLALRFLKKTSSLVPLRRFSAPPLQPELLANYQLESELSMLRASFQLGEGDKSFLKKDRCLVPVSIGKEIHYGAHLAATLSLVNRSFKGVSFVLADSLQGYTKRLSHPDASLEDLKESARIAGTAWLNDNHLLLSQLTIPWHVLRWDTFLEHPEFDNYLGLVKNAYYNNPTFNEGCDENVMEYLNRNPDYPIETEQAKAFGLEYIWFECAAMFIWLEENCQWELYANGRKRAMQETYEHLIEPHHPTLLKPLSLRFKKVRNYHQFIKPETEMKSYEHGRSIQKPIGCLPR